MDITNFETFGKYVLLEKLAMGGMAEVYLARSIGAGGVGKFVAVKRILPQFSEQPEFIEMFKDEASIAINLQHSNIVTITEFGMEKNQFFIVMDFVNGRNLKQILNKIKTVSGSLGIEHIVYVAKEAAAGLDHAHRCLNPATAKPLNIIHRDMSPHNVMISFEGEIKIVDFGIAKAETQIESTRAGTLKGKFGYMSPEQADAQEVDQRTDVFSLGIILWELLANDRLFVGKNEIEILRKIKDCNIQPLRKLNANIPLELEKIVAKALAKERNLRYRNAEDFHRDLHRFLNLKYPDFSTQDFSKFLKTLFVKEIEETHRKLLDYAKLDFSQLVRPKRKFHIQEKSEETVATQKSITRADTGEHVVEKRHSPQSQMEVDASPASKSERLTNERPKTSSPFEVREQGQINIIESSDPYGKPQNLKAEALKIEGPRRGENPFASPGANANIAGSGYGTMSGGSHVGGTYASGSHVGGTYAGGTYAGGTRSRLENSSFHRQSSSYASIITALIVILVIGGGAAWYYSNPERAKSILSALTGISTGDESSNDDAGLSKKELASEQPVAVNLPITSRPPGAEVIINGKSTGEVTPTTISLKDGEEVEWTLRLRGYKPATDRFVVQKGRSLAVNLISDQKAYLDITVMGNGELSINGVPIATRRPISKLEVPANQELIVRVFDPATRAFDETTVNLPENATRGITLIPRAHINNRRPSRR